MGSLSDDSALELARVAARCTHVLQVAKRNVVLPGLPVVTSLALSLPRSPPGHAAAGHAAPARGSLLLLLRTRKEPRVSSCSRSERKEEEGGGRTADDGERTVSSTLSTTHAASVAPSSALTLTSAGSHTNRSMLSATPMPFPPPASSTSSSTLTPAHVSPRACSMRSLLRTSVASRPALSQMVRGITSSALAYALMMSCALPGSVRACERR